MRRVKYVIVSSLAVVMLLAGVVITSHSTMAFIDPGACANTGGDICNRRNNGNVQPLIQGIVNLLLYIAGVVSVVFIIIGGLKYISSAGDPGKAASARNTLVFAVVGLVVSITALAIVRMVYDRVIT